MPSVSLFLVWSDLFYSACAFYARRTQTTFLFLFFFSFFFYPFYAKNRRERSEHDRRPHSCIVRGWETGACRSFAKSCNFLSIGKKKRTDAIVRPRATPSNPFIRNSIARVSLRSAGASRESRFANRVKGTHGIARLNSSKSIGLTVEIIAEQVAILFQELSRALESRGPPRQEERTNTTKVSERENNTRSGDTVDLEHFKGAPQRATTNRSIAKIKTFRFVFATTVSTDPWDSPDRNEP